jgi:hypothetical protein
MLSNNLFSPVLFHVGDHTAIASFTNVINLPLLMPSELEDVALIDDVLAALGRIIQMVDDRTGQAKFEFISVTWTRVRLVHFVLFSRWIW